MNIIAKDEYSHRRILHGIIQSATAYADEVVASCSAVSGSVTGILL